MDMEQILMTRAKARAFGRTCQCSGCGPGHNKVKCGQDIECIGVIHNKVMYLCHACGINLEQEGHRIAELIF
jgi:hypothetical protein